MLRVKATRVNSKCPDYFPPPPFCAAGNDRPCVTVGLGRIHQRRVAASPAVVVPRQPGVGRGDGGSRLESGSLSVPREFPPH